MRGRVSPPKIKAMSQEIFTKDHLRRFLTQRWADRGITITEKERIGVSIDELVAYSNERNSKQELPYVDLWVAIFDECISWLVSLHSVIYGDRKPGKLSVFESATTIIVGKLIADSLAMRQLILAGFNNSANPLLRSVSEYMEVLVAILHAPAFAESFVASDTPEAAQKFWEQHLRGGKIRRRVTAAWNDFMKGDNDPAAQWFANWGRSSQPILSGISHPSYGGALHALIPGKVKYETDQWLGMLGEKSDDSTNTIYTYLHYLFPILLLSRKFPFDGCGAHIQRAYDETNELHRHVQIGRDILASLILSLGTETNKPHIFPECDMSIWPNDDTSNEENE